MTYGRTFQNKREGNSAVYFLYDDFFLKFFLIDLIFNWIFLFGQGKSKNIRIPVRFSILTITNEPQQQFDGRVFS